MRINKYLTAGVLGLFLAGNAIAEIPTKLPAFVVASPGVPGENKIVGTYAQPEWSARRPFPGVGVYVQPAEQIEFEAGFQDATHPGLHQREWSAELEAGLGHRLQLAVENTWADSADTPSGASRWREDVTQVSVRYALADWGRLPLNPALGVSWRFNSGAPDSPGCQLVLGDEIAPRLHWASDLAYEEQTGGPRLQALGLATAITYSVTNETFNVGLQGQWKRTVAQGDPRSHRTELGPCVQYRPRDQLHLDCVVLWGTKRGRTVHTLILSMGFEFGKGADDHDDDREYGGRLGR